MSHNDVFTVLVGGEAGHGVKKAGSVAADAFASAGMSVFEMDDYQSLIRGGHNFTVVSASTRAISSHYERADLVVALDGRSIELHRGHIADGGVMVYDPGAVEGGSPPEVPNGARTVAVPIAEEAAECPRPDLVRGVAAAASLCALLGVSPDALEALVRRAYPKGVESNAAYAGRIHEHVRGQAFGALSLPGGATLDDAASGTKRPIVTGNQAIALGAAAAGLDLYVAYPMTPSSTILHYLAEHDRELGVTVMHPESEIAVANIAIGAAAASPSWRRLSPWPEWPRSLSCAYCRPGPAPRPESRPTPSRPTCDLP